MKEFMIIFDPVKCVKVAHEKDIIGVIYENNHEFSWWDDCETANKVVRCENKPRDLLLHGIKFVDMITYQKKMQLVSILDLTGKHPEIIVEVADTHIKFKTENKKKSELLDVYISLRLFTLINTVIKIDGITVKDNELTLWYATGQEKESNTIRII